MARTTLLLILCICMLQSSAQQLSGRWVGSFIANGDDLINTYRYQIELKENGKHQIFAQTSTQKGDQFYASAFAKGSHNNQTNLIQINETSFNQIKMATELEACLMTNFLTYKNVDGHEILEGTYMSSTINSKRNCGSGKIFLEKESSLLPVQKEKDTNKLKINKVTVGNQSNLLPAKKIKTPTEKKYKIAGSTTTEKNKNLLERKYLNIQSNPVREADTDEIIVEKPTVETSQKIQNNSTNQTIVLPWVLVGRENKLVKIISTNSKKVSFDLYDNGTIDNDTILVYDNKQLIANKKRLSYKSIHLEFNFSEELLEHEVIIVAHNMGTVPPNTALLLFKDEKGRQEYFITSTNKINAKIVIVYTPSKTE